MFISVRDADKLAMVEPARKLMEMGFTLVATRGTANWLRKNGVRVRTVHKVMDGRPHIVDAIKNGEVDLLFNTTDGAQSLADSADIRKTALLKEIPYYTTVAGARASVVAIAALRAGPLSVKPLQAYFKKR